MKLPSMIVLPWTEDKYPDIKTPEFWSRDEVFPPGTVLRWTRFGVVLLENGATLTFELSTQADDFSPSHMLRTLSAAGWRIVSIPYSGGSSFYGEIVFDPNGELDYDVLDNDAALAAELEEFNNEYYGYGD